MHLYVETGGSDIEDDDSESKHFASQGCALRPWLQPQAAYGRSTDLPCNDEYKKGHTERVQHDRILMAETTDTYGQFIAAPVNTL